MEEKKVKRRIIIGEYKLLKIGGENGKGIIALVDPDDWNWINGFKWHLSGGRGEKGYICRSASDLEIKEGKSYCIWLHKEVLERNKIMPAAGQEMVDHKSRYIYDNRKKNLRWVTRSQNGMNRKAQSNSTTKLKGIYFREGKWEVRCSGKYFGRFSDLEDAKRERDRVYLELHGEFCTL